MSLLHFARLGGRIATLSGLGFNMVLSDRDIKEEIARGRIKIEPFDPTLVQPASVDLRLGKKFRVFTNTSDAFIDVRTDSPDLTKLVEIDELLPFVLEPGSFALASVYEKISLPDDIAGRLDGKSSLGRLGILVHATAGWVDPGYQGHLTMELSNAVNLPIILYYGMRIAQISFIRLTSPVENPYGSRILRSKYQGETEPTPSKYYQYFDKAALRSNAALRQWLKKGEFHGSVKLFAEALNVTLKTVENWFYREVEPNQANKLKIFQLTQLPQFRPKGWR
ncbi:dCTP deaminase, dUMP-forming [subsurface metagenome]